MDQHRYLDANVLLRYLTNDLPQQAVQAQALLERVERGDEKVVLSEHHVFEVIFTLQRFYKVPRTLIAAQLRDILSIPGIQLTHESIFSQALTLYAASGASFADAYTAALMQTRGDHQIYSWDQDFDTFPGITRLEPSVVA